MQRVDRWNRCSIRSDTLARDCPLKRTESVQPFVRKPKRRIAGSSALYHPKAIWRRYFKFTSYPAGPFYKEIPRGFHASWQFPEEPRDLDFDAIQSTVEKVHPNSLHPDCLPGKLISRGELRPGNPVHFVNFNFFYYRCVILVDSPRMPGAIALASNQISSVIPRGKDFDMVIS